MKAMVLDRCVDLAQEKKPLSVRTLPDPTPAADDLLIRVSACGVCHTELDEIEGRTPPSRFPMVLGHQVVGTVEETGSRVTTFRPGDRVGVAWIYSACGSCRFCQRDEENICPQFMATGRDAFGGYAQYMTISGKFAHPLSSALTDLQAAPLLCAGAIGYRSLRLAGMQNGRLLGLTGFGASAHLVVQMTRWLYPQSQVFVFARNPKEREFALDLGAVWAGDTTDESPQKLDCIIDTTPVWKPVVEALKNLAPGGRLVINAIRKEDTDKDVLLQLDYPGHLWLEKEIKSVANVARRDVRDFLELAEKMNLAPQVEEFALEDANQALVELKKGNIRGAKVLRIGD